MNMKIIPCAVADFYVRGDGAAVGAAGSHNDVALALTFNETWDGLGKACVFWDARGEGSVLCVLTDEMRADGAYILPIPAEAKRYAGEIRVTISGTEVSENGTVAARAMSTTAYFKVLESDFDADALASVEVPASVAEQLLSDAAATRAIADSVREDADAGKFNGKDGAPGADGKDGAPGANGKDYVLTETDKKEIAGMVEPPVHAVKTYYVDIETGLFAADGGCPNAIEFDKATDELGGHFTNEYEAGSFQGVEFKGVYKGKVFPLSYEAWKFTGYDAETDTFFDGTHDGGKVTFAVTENYMQSKFDAVLCGGAW